MTLLASCIDAGTDATAVFVETGLNPAGDRDRISRLCRRIGAGFIIVRCDMLGLAEVRHNSGDRCYACRHMMMSSVISAAGEAGIVHVADGTNADDIDTGRPGLRAIRELGVLTPFAECGIGRAGVERIASALGVGIMPQSSCLATRFPEGKTLDPVMINMVRLGEEILRRAGVKGMLRLRYVDGGGVIECEQPWRERALDCSDSLIGLGFSHIAISPYGYREGGVG